MNVNSFDGVSASLPIPQSKFSNPLIGPTDNDKIDTLCFCSAVAYANVSSSYPDCSSWNEMSFIIRVSCLCGETLIIKPDPWRTIILQKWGKLVLVSEIGSWKSLMNKTHADTFIMKHEKYLRTDKFYVKWQKDDSPIWY